MTVLKCSGWWEQQGYGRQQMDDLQLVFSNGKLTGAGTDIVGDFHLKGFLDQDRIYLLKQYIGKHQIEYHGTSSGEGAYCGDWSCYGYVGGKWMICIQKSADSNTDSTTDVIDIEPPRH